MAPSTLVANIGAPPVVKHVIQFNPASQLSITLSSWQNFTVWTAQIVMLLHGHYLYGHLHGTTLSPPKTIVTNATETANPEYKDCLWHYLSQVNKDNNSIVDYLHEIRSLSDELATTGSPINNEELVVRKLSGLGLEFRVQQQYGHAILPSAMLNFSTNFLTTKFSSNMRTKKRPPLR
ncbi:hypothetical protein KY290_010964 [Solanum tuberosum]|uniref:Integrase core domain containing protein n=1 Tax=Solanum tuberosum TaxID=4113 RepID=A0ABQ7VZ77_SOLTU|nr:hypothetical protein KY290_010964 [Solanum tuberosum]